MKTQVTKLLLSASLAALFYTVTSIDAHSQPNTKYSHSMLSNVLNIKNPDFLHAGNSKRGAFDTLDFDSLLNDPSFMDLVNDLEQPNHEPEVPLNHLMRDDYMSNVVPGAVGPYDMFGPQPFVPHHVPDNMMDEFMYFLSLKESGRLEKCMRYR